MRHPPYPRWLRAWHWANAALFLVLAATGFSMHFATPGVPLIPFRAARLWHNGAAVGLLALWAAFLAAAVATGHWRQYAPRPRGLVRGMLRQARWYLSGIFRGEPHPFEPTERSRFNPLQRVAYFSVMAGWFPAIAATGLLLLFPEAAPERVLGRGGIWPVAVVHVAAAFAGTAFLVVHAYLGTTGNSRWELYRFMAMGPGGGKGKVRR